VVEAELASEVMSASVRRGDEDDSGHRTHYCGLRRRFLTCEYVLAKDEKGDTVRRVLAIIAVTAIVGLAIDVSNLASRAGSQLPGWADESEADSDGRRGCGPPCSCSSLR
jgi:hypothetical protein